MIGIINMYTVWVSNLGTKICENNDEIDEFMEEMSFGALYEVRYTDSGELVPEWMPF